MNNKKFVANQATGQLSGKKLEDVSGGASQLDRPCLAECPSCGEFALDVVIGKCSKCGYSGNSDNT